ncbi:MAG TPA: apolipoprotein N-acyltransferase [Anaerohalosphaeraceae bacterium]|nr:apolipoprotein N-acyltransferase [Anaerohalosphaeraceae bacterium]HRT52385.1 apolipoprotein N-acyltransferase [Anaerohalosphaeraceae bacterium]HRT88433.1 apolipoprotein N-acyltransferase [Anaerohalosphaeraceae bacterium]
MGNEKTKVLGGAGLTFLGFAASAVMLTLIQAPFRGGFLAWFCLVPFILACGPAAPAWRVAWISYFVGFLYWLGNLYWLGIVTIPAYVAFSAIQGFYWPVLAVSVRFVRQRRPEWLVLAAPALFVGAEAWQGILFTGFGWRLLAHSQWNVLPVIQIADIFGQLGVSVVIALVNGAIAQGLVGIVQERRVKVRDLATIGGACAVLGATLLYGYAKLRQTPAHVTESPLIGAVQPNIPSEIKEMSEAGDAILDDLLAKSAACFEAGATLVAWPETIVLSSLNRDYVDLCRDETRPKVYDQIIADHTKGRGYVLLGAHSAAVDIHAYTITDRYNSAFLYSPDGKQVGRYDKIHLVPFGEYLPFRDSFPLLYKLILKLSPYDYDYNLTKGREYTTFEMNVEGRPQRFGVLICYEDTDPTVTRRMVVSPEGRKKADWLVNISNDGWYVRWKDGKVVPSVELAQRTAITVFRAVENRVGIIRSVNTGISCIVDSTGQIRDGFENGTLPRAAMARQGVEGWFVGRVGIDDRVTFFSRHGRWLDVLCGAAVTLVAIRAIGSAIAERRKQHVKPEKKVRTA